MDYEYDYSDLENDANYKKYKSPEEIMEYKFYTVHSGNYKTYLQSIEWDTWCTPYNPMEAMRLLEEKAIRNHPFNKFF